MAVGQSDRGVQKKFLGEEAVFLFPALGWTLKRATLHISHLSSCCGWRGRGENGKEPDGMRCIQSLLLKKCWTVKPQIFWTKKWGDQWPGKGLGAIKRSEGTLAMMELRLSVKECIGRCKSARKECMISKHIWCGFPECGWVRCVLALKWIQNWCNYCIAQI